MVQGTCRLLAALVAVLGLGLSEGRRQIVPFGNGWKFRYGDDPKGSGTGPNTCAFEDIQNYTCTNMERNPNRFTAEDCHIACCYNPDCMVWQQDAWNGWWKECLHGTKETTCHPDPAGHYHGGKRSSNQQFLRSYNYARADFDDSDWSDVAVPHDFSMNGTFYDSPDHYHGYLPRSTSWYRKHFVIPEAMKNGSLHLHFEGAHHYKEIYVNGVWVMDHQCGYTEFTLRLDNITSLQYGASNVISIRVDASFGSGHWYEGGGIYRSVHLVSTSYDHFTHGGVFVDPESDGSVVKVSAEIESFSGTAGQLPVTFQIKEHSGKVVAKASTAWTGTKGPSIVQYEMDCRDAGLRLWDINNPNTYIFTAILGDVDSPQDTVSFVTGFRTTHWASKFSLNGKVTQLTGFSHHNSFAGTGVVSSERLNLFRVQSSKALGGSFWRMSHNPYEDHLYQILTYSGLMSWDENRDFGVEYTQEMADMVKHHRNHPSIVIWSLCNEFECAKILTNDTGRAFVAAIKKYDTSRPHSSNNLQVQGLPAEFQDVFGYSHRNDTYFANFHAQDPSKPLINSESGGCMADRAVRDVTDKLSQGQAPGLLSYVTGTIGVWTLMDYFGESPGWPSVTCYYGAFDISGFPKSCAWWYRTNWLTKLPEGSSGRPNVVAATATARVMNLLGNSMSSNSSIDGIVSTPAAVLYVDGKVQQQKVADASGRVSWPLDATAVRNATIKAIDASGRVMASHTVLRSGVPYKIQLVTDVPSKATGTGQKLFLDGKDQALIRLQLVDADGVVCTDDAAARLVTVRVSGAGKLVGLGASPSSHYHVQGDQIETYTGLVRIVAQVTLDCTTPNRDLASSIDASSGPNTYATNCPSPLPNVIIEATADGVASGSLEIATSSDFADSPMEVARNSAALSYTYMDDITA